MKLLLFITLLVYVNAEHDTCTDAREITMDDLDANGVATFEGDTSDQEPFCWVCNARLQCPKEYTKNYFYKFTLKERRRLEISTCNTKTNFNTRIAVLTKCLATRAQTCTTSNDDDIDSSECTGGKSQVIFTAEKDVTYYIAVSGPTANDVGTFQITVREFVNDYYDTCPGAKQVEEIPVSFKGVINNEMKVTVPDASDRTYRGTWYKYYNKANQTVFIDTCGGYTSSVDLELYIYKADDDRCMSPERVAYDDNSCGSLNPRIVFDMVQDTYYYILISLKAVVPGETGQYKLNFRTTAADNTRCTGAIGITSVPFKITMPMTHFTTERQWCHEYHYVGMWYTLVGDGNKYIIDTCDSNPTGSDSGYQTEIEVYNFCSAGSMGANCLAYSKNNCGDDAYIEMEMVKGANYFIRATCTSPDCIITLRVEKSSATDNSRCDSPKAVTFMKDGDVYEDNAIDLNSFKESLSGCNGGEVTKGAWYQFASLNLKTQNVHVIVTPKNQANYKPVIELHTDCDMEKCVDTSSNELFQFQFGHSRMDNFRLLYASAVARKDGIERYGTFDFWATMKETLEGETYSNPIVIPSLPYTSIGYINTNTSFVAQCYKENNKVEATVNGAWYKFVSRTDKSIIVNTCGPETHIDTALEVVIPGATFDDRKCLVGNKDDGSAKCGNQALVSVPPTEKQQELYGVVISDPEEVNNFGTYRVSFYVDEAPVNDDCEHIVEVSEFPFNEFIYITKASSTVISYNKKDTSAVGVFYRVKAPIDCDLYIQITDLSEVEGVIALFPTDSCATLEGINRPQNVEGLHTHDTDPYGHRGTYIKKTMKAGDEYNIFVGGRSGSDGIIQFKMTYVENDQSGLDDTTIIIISCVAAAVLLLIIIVIVVVVVIVMKKKAIGPCFNKGNYQQFD